MNLHKNKNKERDERRRRRETDQLDDSDCSDTWVRLDSLPNWPELRQARIYRDKKMARLRRLRRKEERQKLAKEVHAVGSTKSIATTEEEIEDDIPEDMKQRGQWNNSFEFLLSIISMSVGMGNFYRFPFVAFANGGGAFLIPYVIILTFIARPLYLMELAVGQFCSFGQVKVWDMAPIFRGVGYGSVIGSFCVVSYYSAVMATTFYYLFSVFQDPLPWDECDPEWANSSICEKAHELEKNKSFSVRRVFKFPESYFQNDVTQELPDIEDGIGWPMLKQTGCLFAAWLTIYIMIAGGVESSGKAAYITTIYPFVVIFIVLIVAVTKPGSYEGMKYFVYPQWEKMLEPSVWFAAVGQCFFSLSVGFGPIINYASFNPFHHNIYRDCLVVSFMDTMASFIAGLTVFATLGSIAHDTGQQMKDVVNGGAGLVFIAFSDAISNFNYFKFAPQILALLFFTMLLTLAAGSAVAWQMAAISVICDKFTKLRRVWVTVATCIFGFVISLIYVTPGGQYMITLVDNFGGNLNVYILSTLECIGIAWVYGLSNFVKDIEFMLNKRVSWYWKICWGFMIPVMLTTCFIFSLVTGKRLDHNGKSFPDSAIICGWTLTIITIACVPIAAFWTVFRMKGPIKQRLLQSMKPTDEFGPRNPSDRERWKLFKRGIITEGGQGPHTYQLPEGETPSNNNLPSWLTILEDGTVLPRKDVDRVDLEEGTKMNNNDLLLDGASVITPTIGEELSQGINFLHHRNPLPRP